jgi:hypothetical protein
MMMFNIIAEKMMSNTDAVYHYIGLPPINFDYNNQLFIQTCINIQNLVIPDDYQDTNNQ